MASWYLILAAAPLLLDRASASLAACGLSFSPSVCVIRYAADVPCPGCGVTRAAAHFWRGDLESSTTAHPLGAIAVLLTLVLGVYFALAGTLGHRWPVSARQEARWHSLVIATFSLLLVGLWVAQLQLGGVSRVLIPDS